MTDAVITQGESLHEVAEITVIHEVTRGAASGSGWNLISAGVLSEGQPLALRYGIAARSKIWHGYITAVSVRGDEIPQTSLRTVQVPVVYTCVGPTRPMQSQANRLWSSTTASFVARKLARGTGLRPQVQRSSRLFGTIPQQAKSDFALLRDLADEVGYRLTTHGTTLAFTHPLVSLREADEERPSFRLAKDATDTVKTWESTAGQLDPLGGRHTRREGYSFNINTGALVRHVAAGTQDSVITQYSTGRPFTSQAEAVEILNAEARRDALWVHATATVVGDARVRTGTELEMTGGALGPDDPGLWMVRSATHRISVVPDQPAAGRYWLDVTLGRNRIGGLDLISKDEVVDTIQDGTALIDGRWCAQHIGRA
ncbi:hypothetical protein AB0A69_07800 [Streptomyces sp. NPDC045431]|uniref:hypothetical protein n=1 Tax=Streptomyces sp. NPDC045431 TaxID=3155613 RepID=UPI0033F69930